MKVIKRDGTTVEFDRNKIKRAIRKANEAVDPDFRVTEEQIEQIVHNIESKKRDRYLVEDIQDMVEHDLMLLGKYTLSKKYIIYRYERALVRHANTTDDSILSLIKNANKDVMEENSNKNAVMASTQRDLIAGEVSKDLTRRILLPEEISKAHDEGVLHFHDADYFLQPIFNCCLINIGDMLDNGTVMNGKMIESPKSFQVACTIMTQIIAAVASSQYGGQSVDIGHLGKYLRRSREKFYSQLKNRFGDELPEDVLCKITETRLRDELRSGVQTIQYQINTLMTTNGQSPFVTLFMYIREDDEYVEENAMIIEEILNQRYEGIKNEKGVYVTPAFPKLIYVLDECNCLKGGKYDYITRLAVKCSAKRLYPDYISAKKMRENYEGNVFSPMGCRSFLSPYRDENGRYKFEGRFNQGVVSINLPQIGILARGEEEIFWKLFDERLALCKRALICRHEALEGTLSDTSPVHWQYGAIARLEKGEKIDKYLHGGYSTISLGYIGLYEVTKLMTGVSHTDPKGKNARSGKPKPDWASDCTGRRQNRCAIALPGSTGSASARFRTLPTRAITPTPITWTCGSISTLSASSPLKASSRRYRLAALSPTWRSRICGTISTLWRRSSSLSTTTFSTPSSIPRATIATCAALTGRFSSTTTTSGSARCATTRTRSG